jgi:hypothetical protein
MRSPNLARSIAMGSAGARFTCGELSETTPAIRSG